MKKILDQYEKYLQAIKNCNDDEIPYNFNKFDELIHKHIEGEPLVTLMLCSANETIEELLKRELTFKKLAKAWDSAALATFFVALNRLKEKKQEWFKNSTLVSMPEEIKVLEANVVKTIFKTKDPSMQLFMYKQYRDNVARGLFESYSHELEKMLQCSEKETVCLEAK